VLWFYRHCPFFFKRYSNTERGKIGSYAHHCGVAAAARHYSRLLNCYVTDKIVLSIRDTYRKCLKFRRQCAINECIGILPEKGRGRPLLLSQNLDRYNYTSRK